MSLFSSLGQSEVFHVFCLLSSHPWREYWLGHIPEDAMKLLVDVNGPFVSCPIESLSVEGHYSFVTLVTVSFVAGTW